MRVAAALSLIAWSIHSYVFDVRPALLPYCFFIYFIGDFPYCTPDFKLHHILGASVAWYGIMVPDSPMGRPMIATELSSPFFIALRYCPPQMNAPLRIVFAGTFFVVRIYHFGYALVQWDPYASPYPAVGMLGFYGMFVLNAYWFGLILYKMTPRGEVPWWPLLLEFINAP